jgi:mediator of RNA polymerase II transcription subunit 14
LSSSVSLPSIYVRLSELLPSKNKSARTGKPWAKDIIKITFKGIELLPAKPKEIAPSDPAQNQISQTPVATQQSDLTGLPSPTLEEIAVLISEARMIVPIPNALANINEKVDRDIAFNPESGSFSFRLRSKIGESVINSLIERTVRVERLVEFVQVLQKHENVLKCETVSLGKIVFTYGSPPPAPDAMDLDVASDRYKAVVDFSAVENNMQLVLERGNPHLQIADLLTKVLNGTEGLDGVATLLPLTLPVLRALDTIVFSWTSSPFCERADVFNNVRAADWYIIRYNIKKMSPQGPAQPQVRKIMFEVRMRQRRGAPWWHIRRTDNARTKETDDLDEALKPLWADKGRGWLGMRTSAVAEAYGAEELIRKVDDIVRKLVTSEVAVAAPPIVQAPAPAPAPVQNQTRAPAPAQQQQRQQQPTPNQSQNQSQGRNATVKREVVEID